jgi:hypothetical protein
MFPGPLTQPKRESGIGLHFSRELKMRKLVWLLFVCSAVAMNSPASASSIFFTYSGTVSSDVSYAFPPGPTFTPLVFGNNNLTGQSVFISETFNLANADLIYQGAYYGQLPNNKFASAEITIGNISATFQGNFGSFAPTLGGFSSEIGSKGPFSGIAPTTFVLLNYSSAFTPNGLQADGSLTAVSEGFSTGRTLDFNVTSETFAVSAVPLPPALPMFASALLALGLLGVYARRGRRVSVEMAV